MPLKGEQFRCANSSTTDSVGNANASNTLVRKMDDSYEQGKLMNVDAIQSVRVWACVLM